MSKSVKDILIEMKNLSELMVDLAYSALLFNSRDAAEEVIKLENKVNRLNYEIKKESLLAARSVEDAEELTALLEVGEAAESIANSAKDIADLVLKGIKPHPVFKMVMEESDEIIVRVTIEEGSELAGKSLGDLLLATRTGMRVIAIRRGESWIYGPDRNTVLAERDTLIAKGNEAGAELLFALAKNEMTLEDIGCSIE
ncbi:potassium channel protein [Methanothermobacter thermautotrophicus]|uniref:Potassium channel protein n=2 Tax=Methanothermobacter thermautotrophicus TaxID=145262 RepID=A0A842YL05_METTF|nr:potassium channel protein [Methanothermobacter thermautotrophicus]MCQ8905624.1 potassium channel family protein [Methanothermobacter sp.]